MEQTVHTRPPSQSLNSYGTADDVRSPTGSAGTPGPMPQQPSSQQSTDNNSEAAQAGRPDLTSRLTNGLHRLVVSSRGEGV
ncbi:hypothetical protein HPB48_019145 [Haemaphysalis longicornis]|uniref:Uncharacterized protein n=1 Tax=Haemaphysalis longicornis TaxID=44386 RepID=A0A9J6GKF3_HAELO|nr:hypothetical protein HPB48_019145 [Haemaphysalis longicornis]